MAQCLHHPARRSISFLALPLLAALIAVGCTPRVEVMAPREPITINLNVKIKHEILVKVDKQIDELFEENSELF